MVAMPTSCRFSWLRRFSSASARATRVVSIRWRAEVTSAALLRTSRVTFERSWRWFSSAWLRVIRLWVSSLRASAFESGIWNWRPKE